MYAAKIKVTAYSVLLFLMLQAYLSLVGRSPIEQSV